MHFPEYSRFTLEEFTLDETFRAWVLTPTPELEAFWQPWLLAHEHQRETVQQATILVRHLQVRSDDLGEGSQQRIWETLETHLDKRPAVPLDRPTGGRIWQLPRWSRVAAAFVVLLLAGLAATPYFLNDHGQKIHTAYGETRTVTLPDGSTVLLNGNSTLTYTDDWSEGGRREVWLDGEGFFKITKKEASRSRVKFITHTPNLDITVLGTRFNVNTRRGTTAVTLIEGRVQLHNPRNREARLAEMKPGEHATLPSGTQRVEVRPVKTDLHDAWTRHLFVFENTPLREVATALRDTYGLDIVFENSELADKRFTANLADQSLETLLTVIATTYNLSIETTNQHVRLRAKPD